MTPSEHHLSPELDDEPAPADEGLQPVAPAPEESQQAFRGSAGPSTGPAGRVARRLLRLGRGGRMRPPGQRRCYRALAVADVDLDTMTATLLPPLTAGGPPPEGVHALVWLHGRPVAEVTVPGAPETALGSLPEIARREARGAVLVHLLRDALAAEGGLRAAAREPLPSLPHPPENALETAEITVAVCTRDRPDDLRRCLAALRASEPAPAEVLVIDNASADDRTRRVAEEFGARCIREPRPGLDFARNRALLEARTRVVAFTDDDVIVYPGWVAGIARAFAEEPDAVAVTGLVAPAELASPAQVLFEFQGGFGRGYQRKWFSVPTALGDVAAQWYPGMGGAGTGANMALLRDEALALGGFDPALDVGTATGGGGDLEMFFRVLAAGRLLVYEPSAVVRHVHRGDMAGLVRQMRGHGTGSYSIFTGAGRHYGPRQNRALRRFAIRWALNHHLQTHGRSLLYPRTLPWSMIRAETGGMVGAVLGRYYARAESEALERAAACPDEPDPPALRRPPAGGRRPRTADPVLDVDLLGTDLSGDGPLLDVESSRLARRIRVRVARDGRPQDAFVVSTAGSQPSRARLRAELVYRLGPALLVPGTSWNEVADEGDDLAALEGLRAQPQPPPASTPPVSVLMATRDRPESMRRSVEALLRDTAGHDVRVVVVDNSPDPAGTRAALRDVPRTVVVHEPRPGLSRARNAGTPHLTGDVVVLVDDDVVTTPGWLDELLVPFADPEVVAVTGNVLPAELTGLEPQLFEDYGGLGRGPQRRVYRPRWLRRGLGAVPTWLIGATANAAIRREVLERLGPWDEALGAGRPAGVGEDTEYFYRLLHAGGTIVYQPTAVVLHHHRPDRAALRDQLRAYSAGHVAYHLEILTRYGDPRGLRRLAVGLPRYYLNRARWIARGVDDYPAELLRTEVLGMLTGVAAWVRSRASSR